MEVFSGTGTSLLVESTKEGCEGGRDSDEESTVCFASLCVSLKTGCESWSFADVSGVDEAFFPASSSTLFTSSSFDGLLFDSIALLVTAVTGVGVIDRDEAT